MAVSSPPLARSGGLLNLSVTLSDGAGMDMFHYFRANDAVL